MPADRDLYVGNNKEKSSPINKTAVGFSHPRGSEQKQAG